MKTIIKFRDNKFKVGAFEVPTKNSAKLIARVEKHYTILSIKVKG